MPQLGSAPTTSHVSHHLTEQNLGLKKLGFRVSLGVMVPDRNGTTKFFAAEDFGCTGVPIPKPEPWRTALNLRTQSTNASGSTTLIDKSLRYP